MTATATLTIDARGQRCPWPSIRLARALREGHQAVQITADDPAAGRELAAVAAAANAQIAQCPNSLPPVYFITVPTHVNLSFTSRV